MPKQVSKPEVNHLWERVDTVVLVGGRKVKIRALPPFIAISARSKVPLPDPPIVEIASELPGGTTQRFLDEKNPEYLLALRKAEQAREEIYQDLIWAYGLPEVEPPEDDGWKREIEQLVPDIPWKDGKIGRKIDYIKYVVISSQADANTVQVALHKLSLGITEEEVKAAEESFRSKVEGKVS